MNKEQESKNELTNSASKFSLVIIACLIAKSTTDSNCVYMSLSNIICACTYSSPVNNLTDRKVNDKLVNYVLSGETSTKLILMQL